MVIAKTAKALDKLNAQVKSHRTLARRHLDAAKELLDDDPHDRVELAKTRYVLERKRDDLASKFNEIEELIDIEQLDHHLSLAAETLDELDGMLVTLELAVEATSAKEAPEADKTPPRHRDSAAKLPKLSIPTFRGDVLEYSNYWELFNANVHQLAIDKVQKFSYLRTTLEGEPATLIGNLELSADNYDSAITMLQERYGDKNRIIQEHYKKLLNLEPGRESYRELKQFYDSLELHIRGLEGQGKDKDGYGDLLALILMEKMSSTLRRTLARDHRSTAWSLKDPTTSLLPGDSGDGSRRRHRGSSGSSCYPRVVGAGGRHYKRQGLEDDCPFELPLL